MTALVPRVSHIRVSEIFGPTIQGEGELAGTPTVFVRTGGCDYRCSWCDSLHAVLPEYRDEWKPMLPGAICETVLGLTNGRPILVTLSGGNPALQPLNELLGEGKRAGLTFAMETQGSTWREWMRRVDYLVVSPKPPSSGMEVDRNRLAQVLSFQRRYNLGPRISLKVVVMERADLDWALALHADHPRIPFYLQTGNPNVGPIDNPARASQHRERLLDRTRWLAEQVVERRAFDVRVLPQLHTLLWGNDRGR